MVTKPPAHIPQPVSLVENIGMIGWSNQFGWDSNQNIWMMDPEGPRLGKHAPGCFNLEKPARTLSIVVGTKEEHILGLEK
jgi:hypothetical protein